MANKFVRGPQGVTNNDDAGDAGRPSEGQQQYSAYWSSVYAQEQAAGTQTMDVVTQTAMVDDTTVTSSPEDETTDIGDGSTAGSMDSFTTEPSSSYWGYTRTTLATQTSNQPQQTSSPQSTDTPLVHTTQSDGGDDGGLSGGQLTAAIAVPIIFTALFALLALIIFRRRRKTSSQHQPRPDSRSTGLFGLREKWGSLRSSASSQNHEDSPQMTSGHHNNTFLADLDTLSRHTSPMSPRQVNDSPPAYHPRATTIGPPVLARNMTNFSHPRPSQDLQVPPPAAAAAETFLNPNPSFLRSTRPGSTRSINSDAYSDTASIHSARAARMSVGTIIAPGLYGSANKSGSVVGGRAGGDPFGTPTPSLAFGRGRSRQGSGESKESKASEKSETSL